MHPYAIPPLVAIFFTAGLGIYIISKDPRSRVNQIAGLAMLIVTVSVVGESGLRLSALAAHARIWSHVLWVAIGFMGPIFLHLALLCSRRRKILDRGPVYLALYLPSILFIFLIFGTGLLAVDFVTRYWGLDPIHGWIILVPVVYNTVAFLLGIGVLSQEYRKSHGIERKQTSLILTGLVVIFVIAYVFTAALARIFDTVEMGSPFNVIGCAIIVYGIVKYKLFVLPPLPRFFIPTPEERLRTKLKYRLREGQGYLVKERKPVRSAEIFVDQTRHGVPGLWITSLHPRKPCEEYGLSKTLVLSLTPDRITGEMTVTPNKLGHARGIVSGYLSRVRGRSVVMLDCFKELVVANGFERAMNFLKELAELCLKNNSNLIVQIDPAAFTKRQLAEIERALREEREKKR